MVGGLSTKIVTSAKEEVQGEVEMVQRKTLLPKLSPVIVVFGEFELAKEPVPETIDQEPVPTSGVFAAVDAVEEHTN